MWTCFIDMHSGGGTKVKPYDFIYINAPEDEAKTIFENQFARDPENVTCNCCGQDYSIDSDEDLARLTAFHRNCAYLYFGPDGSEWPEREARKAGYQGRYVEKWNGKYGKYQTLEEYKTKESVCFLTPPAPLDEEKGKQ